MQPGSARSTNHDTNALDPLSRSSADHLSLVETPAPERRTHFATDPVRGQPIGDHVRSNRLDPGQRVELFLQACDAVAKAHEEGISHGGLHSDALVVSGGDEGVRVLGPGVSGTASLEFRSPEQVIADRVEATARGDVYSLGVVLYRLLVDCLPHDAATLERARDMGMLAWTYEDGPLSLVARVSLLGTRSERVASERRLDPSGLMSAVAGRLNDVVGKALRPDPSTRYADAGELARALRK